jgi:hypothetical protein
VGRWERVSPVTSDPRIGRECSQEISLCRSGIATLAPDITLHNLRVGESTITLRFWKENKETRHEVLALEGDLLVERRSGLRNLPNERAQFTYNGRFQDHRERGLASGLV